MKKFFALLASALCTVGALAAESVFSVDFSTATADDFAAWTVADVNDDNSTWVFSEKATPSRVYYSYNTTNNGDDWLISPSITIPNKGVYALIYEFKGSSYSEAFEAWVGNSASVSGMTTKLAEHPDVRDANQSNVLFFEAEPGSVHIVFHCISNANKYRLYINSVRLVEAVNPVDLCVSEIVSPATGEGLGNESVTVKVSNRGFIDVDSYDVAYSVNGGDAVVEHVTKPLAMGETCEYTFTAKADLSMGHYTHTIKAWTEHAEDLNPSNNSVEVKVKHIAPAGVPYRMGFEVDDDVSGMTFLNLNKDDAEWHIATDDFFVHFSRTGSRCLGYSYSRENSGDDWAFLEPISMEAGYYVLKFWYSATENHKERMKVFYGNAPTPEAMTNLIAEYNPIENEKYAEAINIFEIKDSGKVYIGFYCFSDADENWLVIDDLSIDKVDADWFDIIVGDLTSPRAYFRDGSSDDVSFTIQNIGIHNADVKVCAYIDGKEAHAKTYTVKGQQTLPVVLSGALRGLSEGTHTIKVEALCDGVELSNNVIEREFTVLGAAVRLWDFEGGTLPSDLTFRKEDSAVNHPSSGAEFNEDGFGIFQISNTILGSHALAVNTWFTESVSADRWVVLPQMTVTGDNAHFVWNSNSINSDYREKYVVAVSPTTDMWSQYYTEYTVNSEDIYVQTHGISLGKYKDKDIYIAINVKTTDGEALLLDNLGVYGDIRAASSGIAAVDAAGECKLVIDGNILKVYGAEAKSIEIYGLDGVLLVGVQGEFADISALSSGMYVARVVTADGVVAAKFVK